MKSRIRIILILLITVSIILQNTVLALAKNGEGSFQLNKNSYNQEMPLSKKQVMRCVSMMKEEVLAAYGHNFEVVRTGSEGEQEGDYYQKIGITFVFLPNEPNGKVLRIECDNNISINGAKAGMNFDQIKEKLGDVPIRQTFIEEYYKIYLLEYVVDNCRVVFSSFKTDGMNSRLMLIEKRSD